MFFLGFYGLGILSALGRLALGKRRSRDEAAEVVLQHLLVLGYGVGGVFAFIGHRFRADEVARSIGWPTGNPFQEEIAWANLGGGGAGLLCLCARPSPARSTSAGRPTCVAPSRSAGPRGLTSGQLSYDRSQRVGEGGAADDVGEADLLPSPLDFLGGGRRGSSWPP